MAGLSDIVCLFAIWCAWDLGEGSRVVPTLCLCFSGVLGNPGAYAISVEYISRRKRIHGHGQQ